MMCSVNCDGCYAKNHCDVVPNSMNCQEVREDAEKEQRIRADERKKALEEVEKLYRDWLYSEYGKKADTDNLTIRVINHLKEQLKGEKE